MSTNTGQKRRRVAIVTGHTRGIGRAVAELLEEKGYAVHGFDLPEVDLADPASIAVAASRVLAKEGAVDVLVNNAGISNMGSLLEISPEEIDRVLAVNLKGPMLLMKAVLPAMLAQKRGAIVNVASDQAFIGKRFAAVYGASKAGIAQLTKSAALDFAEQGVRVNAVAPGSTDTPMLRWVFEELHKRYPAVYPTAGEDFYKASIPQKRFASPREIAEVIAFLASDAASFVTGAVIPVDGGFTAQ